MTRRIATSSVASLLATTFCVLAVSAAFAAPVHAQTDSAEEARALKEAEVKLAALAKEGREGGIQQPAPQKEPEKKKARPVRKKRHARPRVAHARLQPVAANGAKVQNVTNRRLTQSEVQGILSTTRDFSGADLSGMSLVGMDFSGVKFNRANLQRVNLERADLDETDLELADLTGANLRGASLNQARLRGTRMEASRLDGALWIDKTVCKKGSIGTCIE